MDQILPVHACFLPGTTVHLRGNKHGKLGFINKAFPAFLITEHKRRARRFQDIVRPFCRKGRGQRHISAAGLKNPQHTGQKLRRPSKTKPYPVTSAYPGCMQPAGNGASTPVQLLTGYFFPMPDHRRFRWIHSGAVAYHLMDGLVQIRHIPVIGNFKKLHPIGHIHYGHLTDFFRASVRKPPYNAFHASAIQPYGFLLKQRRGVLKLQLVFFFFKNQFYEQLCLCRSRKQRHIFHCLSRQRQTAGLKGTHGKGRLIQRVFG